MKIFGNIKKRWDAYLARLGEANKKNFGSGSLECCKLNQYEEQNHKKTYMENHTS